MTWTMTPAPTEVELTFTALAHRLTRVAVEHRGWEALTEEQLGEDCALPGGYAGGSYAAGWGSSWATWAPSLTLRQRKVSRMSVDPESVTLESYELVLSAHPPGQGARPGDHRAHFLEHLDYTMGLVNSGQQLAAGPVRDSPAEESTSAA